MEGRNVVFMESLEVFLVSAGRVTSVGSSRNSNPLQVTRLLKMACGWSADNQDYLDSS